MGLNIKNLETERLIRELAALHKMSLVEAVTVAVKEKLDQEKQEAELAKKRHDRMAWLDRITKETAAIMNDGRSSTELIEELYDPETGLPR